MALKKYKYPLGLSIMRYFFALMVVIGMLIWIIAIFQRIYSPFRIFEHTGCDPSVNECLRSTIGMIISFIIMLILINGFPTIVLQDNGIIVEFLFLHYSLNWSDIQDIKLIEYSFVKWWIVTTTKLPPVFGIYGIYVWTLKPSFWIFKNMKNHEELIFEIQRHLHQTKVK